MRTETQKRYNSHLHYYPKRLITDLSKQKIKRIYTRSLENVARHPYRSFGLLALGLSILSGIFWFYRKK